MSGSDVTSPITDAWRAYALLRSEDVGPLLTLPTDGKDVVLRSIALVAQGTASVHRQDEERARRCFEEAFTLGVPLAANLRQCGRYFFRTGAFGKAHECYSLLNHLEPGADWEFFSRLPAEQFIRYGAPWAATLFFAERPLFYSLRYVKDALVAAFGNQEASFVLARWLFPETAMRSFELPRLGLQAYARQHAERYEVLIPGRDVTLRAPRVHHGERPAGISGRSREVFFCVLRDIVVTSKSNLLLASDGVLMDFQDNELAAIQIHMNVDPLIMDAVDSTMTVIDREESARLPPLREALALTGVHSFNYGHWVFELMFQVWAVMNQPGFADVAIVIDEKMFPQHRELLEFFVGPTHPIVVLRPGESVRVDRLWTCSKIAYWPAGDYGVNEPVVEVELSDPEQLVRIIDRLQEPLDTVLDPAAPERIYLTRKPTQARPIRNRPQVEAWFAARRFSILEFGSLSMREQLRYLRNARMIIVEDGSQTLGLLFARRGTRIGIMAHPSIDEMEWTSAMARSLEQPLLAFPMTLVGFDPANRYTAYELEVDITQLEGFIAELEQLSPD